MHVKLNLQPQNRSGDTYSGEPSTFRGAEGLRRSSAGYNEGAEQPPKKECSAKAGSAEARCPDTPGTTVLLCAFARTDRSTH